MTCSLCEGTGNHFCVQEGRKEWWACQACDGAGTQAVMGPPGVRARPLPFKSLTDKARKMVRELDGKS